MVHAGFRRFQAEPYLHCGEVSTTGLDPPYDEGLLALGNELVLKMPQ